MVSNISHSATQVYNLILLWANNSIIIFGAKTLTDTIPWHYVHAQ